LAATYYCARNYDRAIALAREALDLQPAFTPALWTLGFSFAMKGDSAGALRTFETLAAANPSLAGVLAWQKARMGDKDAAREILSGLRNYGGLGAGYLALGETNVALDFFEKAAEEHLDLMLFAKVDPI